MAIEGNPSIIRNTINKIVIILIAKLILILLLAGTLLERTRKYELILLIKYNSILRSRI